MKKNDSVKRLIILALGLIGLCVLTAFYAHDWFAYYYHHIAWKTHNRFNVNGHLLIVALYFILLLFHSTPANHCRQHKNEHAPEDSGRIRFQTDIL